MLEVLPAPEAMAQGSCPWDGDWALRGKRFSFSTDGGGSVAVQQARARQRLGVTRLPQPLAWGTALAWSCGQEGKATFSPKQTSCSLMPRVKPKAAPSAALAPLPVPPAHSAPPAACLSHSPHGGFVYLI